MIRFYNGRLLAMDGGMAVTEQEVWTDGSVIRYVGPARAEMPAFERKIDLRGNLRASYFELYRDDTLCARILKRVMSWGDTYVVTLTDPDTVPLFGALAVAVDNALYHNR